MLWKKEKKSIMFDSFVFKHPMLTHRHTVLFRFTLGKKKNQDGTVGGKRNSVAQIGFLGAPSVRATDGEPPPGGCSASAPGQRAL